MELYQNAFILFLFWGKAACTNTNSRNKKNACINALVIQSQYYTTNIKNKKNHKNIEKVVKSSISKRSFLIYFAVELRTCIFMLCTKAIAAQPQQKNEQITFSNHKTECSKIRIKIMQIALLSKTTEWYKGMNQKTKLVGYFPSNYIQETGKTVHVPDSEQVTSTTV